MCIFFFVNKHKQMSLWIQLLAVCFTLFGLYLAYSSSQCQAQQTKANQSKTKPKDVSSKVKDFKAQRQNTSPMCFKESRKKDKEKLPELTSCASNPTDVFDGFTKDSALGGSFTTQGKRND